MLRIVAFLFCFNVIFLPNLHAQETLKDYLGISENEIEEIRKIERIYSGEDILVPSLIGDQAEWTQVDPREIPSDCYRNTKDWIDTVFKQGTIVQNKREYCNDGMTGWRRYFGYMIHPSIKNPREYRAGISMLAWQYENDGNKFLVVDGIQTLDIWINLNAQRSKQDLNKSNIERFSKDVLTAFFPLSENSIEALQCKARDNKGTFQCCDLQVTFDMNTRPKVTFNDREYPKTLTWSEQFKIMTNGKVVRVSLPKIKDQEVLPDGVGFVQQPLSQSEPIF